MPVCCIFVVVVVVTIVFFYPSVFDEIGTDDVAYEDIHIEYQAKVTILSNTKRKSLVAFLSHLLVF